MAHSRDLDPAILSECFECDPETASLIWRHRPRRHFASDKAFNIWSAKYPGKAAFTQQDQHGYRTGRLKIGDTVYNLKVHRVVFAMAHGYFPDEVDHIDGDCRNNSISNLRAATRTTNGRNMRAHRDRDSALPKWVCRVGRRFKAQVRGLEGQSKHIGFFDTPEEAYQAALQAAQQRHGTFMRPD